MNKWQALQSFWQSFGLAVYDEQTVPDNATMPYITFSGVADGFGSETVSTASLWYRSKSWSEISQKEIEIFNYIGMGGVMVKYDEGAVWVKRGTPWANRMGDINDDVRRIVLNVELEFIN